MSTDSRSPKIRSIRFNIVMNTLLTGTTVLFPMLIYPYASRVLKPEGIGTVGFANAVISYFAMFAQLGIPTYGIRACSLVRDDREALSRRVREILSINLVTTLISFGAFLACVMLVPRLREEKLLFCVMGCSMIFTTLGVEWLYKGLEQYAYITVRSLIFKLLALIGVFAFVRGSGDYVTYGFFTVFALIGSNLLNFIHMKDFVDLRGVTDCHPGRHLRSILVFFAMSAATIIYSNMDSVMLGFLSGNVETGYYDVGIKIKNVLVMGIVSVGTVLLPRISLYIEKGKEEDFRRTIRRSSCLVLLLALPLSLFFEIFTDPAVLLIAGPLYERSVLPMRIIMPALVMIGITNVTGIQVLVPRQKEKVVLWSEIAGAAVNLVLNSILIPGMGAAGAALGTLAAELAVLLVQALALGKELPRIFDGKEIAKIFGSLIPAGLAGLAVARLRLEVLPELCLGSLAFFACYVLCLGLFREELFREYLRDFLKRWTGRRL